MSLGTLLPSLGGTDSAASANHAASALISSPVVSVGDIADRRPRSVSARTAAIQAPIVAGVVPASRAARYFSSWTSACRGSAGATPMDSYPLAIYQGVRRRPWSAR